MKIAIAQIKSNKGDIANNIEIHKKHIEIAVKNNADAIFFPELSLTGYEPEMSKTLATNQDDARLDIFQQISNKEKITIAVGLPTFENSSVKISSIIFQSEKPIQTYSKQYLHPDELRFFASGEKQILIEISSKKIAPAICFESLQVTHCENAKLLGADIYVASVAKHEGAVQKGLVHYPAIASKFRIPVLMSNCVGYCDNFLSAGQSSVWDKNGILKEQLDNKSEGIIIFDTMTEEVSTKIIS